MSTRVEDNPEASRFEAFSDDRLAGWVEYSVDGDVVTLPHTKVDDAFEGQGIGSALAKGALGAVREQGRKVQPTCPFIKGYIDKHPEWQDLVV